MPLRGGPIEREPRPDDVTETAAQILHLRRHRAGTANVCGECIEDARLVTAAVANQIEFGAEQVWLGAREYYGVMDHESDTHHGAECDRVKDNNYRCTCDEARQRKAFREWYG